jgi:hypothetical protein
VNEWIICIGEAASTGVYGIVDTLTISSHGAFYAGDSITSAGGHSAHGIAIWQIESSK